jgi:hypothetical protein
MELLRSAMTARLEDYYTPVGKLTMAAALLEEVALRWVAMLSDDPVNETRFKFLTRGLEQTLTMLADLVTIRISATNQQSVIDLIVRGRKLKDQRNESVHGVWGEMENAETGAFSHVARSRYEKTKATRSVQWDLSVPKVEDLQKLADDLHSVAHSLNNRMGDLWDIDEGIQSWRRANNI